MLRRLHPVFKRLVRSQLERNVRRYLATHGPKVVLVTKASTKLAVATVLRTRYPVRVQEGSQNTDLSAPLGILGIPYPHDIRSVSAWLSVRRAALKRIRSKDGGCDVIVQELGARAPGEIPHFGTYLRGDLAIVTAVGPEHMEYFTTLDAVAAEELSVTRFATRAAVNRDDVPAGYLEPLANTDTRRPPAG